MNKIYKIITILGFLWISSSLFSMDKKFKSITEIAPTNQKEEDYLLAQALQASINRNQEETKVKSEKPKFEPYLSKKRNNNVRQTLDSIGFNEFQVSLKEDNFNLPIFIDKNNKNKVTNMYFEGVPLIGVYNGDNYNMLNRVALIQNRQRMVTTAPESLLKELGDLKNKQIDFFTVIYSMPRNPRSTNQVYNLVLHPWARTLKKGAKDEKNFSIKLPMGIFQANGVHKKGDAPVAFEKFNPEDVVIHPVGNGELAFSPNNAHFNTMVERHVSTFWSAATSPDKKRAVIVFNVLFNDPKTAQLIMGITKYAKTLGDLINNMQIISATNDLKAEDKQALKNAVEKIKQMVNIK